MTYFINSSLAKVTAKVTDLSPGCLYVRLTGSYPLVQLTADGFFGYFKKAGRPISALQPRKGSVSPMLTTFCCSVCGTRVIDLLPDSGDQETDWLSWPVCPNAREHYESGQLDAEDEHGYKHMRPMGVGVPAETLVDLMAGDESVVLGAIAGDFFNRLGEQDSPGALLLLNILSVEGVV